MTCRAAPGVRGLLSYLPLGDGRRQVESCHSWAETKAAISYLRRFRDAGMDVAGPKCSMSWSKGY